MLNRKSSIVVLVGALLSFISVFLPYVSVEFFGMSQSVKLLDGKDGYILMILVILTAVFMFLNNAKAFYGLAGASIVWSVYEFIDCKSELKEFGDMIKYGAGCWLSIIGAVVIAAGVALYALEEKKNA